ncbi:UNKNOWN [Stylonychia lemnae]|uniref:Uncharacterized protein n=1 Tax=Stylonychia lemnae TaxID=5949 RepID=A0A078B9B1_STYLE|nr:UNKNOWN [Stylonychia lemnae]|eukprot:CDW91105.1 UNKNOWN [Stylonychia lemnae]
MDYVNKFSLLSSIQCSQPVFSITLNRTKYQHFLFNKDYLTQDEVYLLLNSEQDLAKIIESDISNLLDKDQQQLQTKQDLKDNWMLNSVFNDTNQFLQIAIHYLDQPIIQRQQQLYYFIQYLIDNQDNLMKYFQKPLSIKTTLRIIQGHLNTLKWEQYILDSLGLEDIRDKKQIKQQQSRDQQDIMALFDQKQFGYPILMRFKISNELKEFDKIIWSLYRMAEVNSKKLTLHKQLEGILLNILMIIKRKSQETNDEMLLLDLIQKIVEQESKSNIKLSNKALRFDIN